MKLSLLLIATFFIGCSNNILITTNTHLGKVKQQASSVSLFRLTNYTDTPRAGMRSANLVEGILLVKGYKVVNHITEKEYTFKEARNIALLDHSKYFFIGGVSEWRYKTGIDGEPAVSLQCSLYDTNGSNLIWSATASNSDWGTNSIGTTAQKLIETMMDK
jgi:hypothetical protein